MQFSRALVPLLLLFVFSPTQADEIDDMLEKARTAGAKYERIRKIINEEPDQNVRLAAFDLMVNHDDKNMKAIAIDAGLASTDRLLQAKAFQAAVFDLESIHLTLVEGDNGSKKKPAKVLYHIENTGNTYVILMESKDLEKGVFKASNYRDGEIFGTNINYTDYSLQAKATFELKDDNAIEGIFEIQGYKYVATGKLR